MSSFQFNRARLGIAMQSRQKVALFLAAWVTLRCVVGYESVYDLIERQNQRRFFGVPKENFPYRHDSFYRSRIADIPSTDVPADFDSFATRTRFFGNGYDNIGNGIGSSFDVRRVANQFFLPAYGREHMRDFRGGYSIVRHPVRSDGYTFNRQKPVERGFLQEERGADRAFETSSGQSVRTAQAATDSRLASKEDKKQRQSGHNYGSSQESVEKDSRKTENFGEEFDLDRNEANKSTLRSNRVSKKGHTTRGFSTHHHKDETGNTTTFYDQFSDHGGQFDFKDSADGYGMKTRLEQASDTEDGKFFKESRNESRNHDTGYDKENQKFERGFASSGDQSRKEERFDGGRENEILKHRKNGYNSGEPDIFHYDSYYFDY